MSGETERILDRQISEMSKAIRDLYFWLVQIERSEEKQRTITDLILEARYARLALISLRARVRSRGV